MDTIVQHGSNLASRRNIHAFLIFCFQAGCRIFVLAVDASVIYCSIFQVKHSTLSHIVCLGVDHVCSCLKAALVWILYYDATLVKFCALGLIFPAVLLLLNEGRHLRTVRTETEKCDSLSEGRLKPTEPHNRRAQLTSTNFFQTIYTWKHTQDYADELLLCNGLCNRFGSALIAQFSHVCNSENFETANHVAISAIIKVHLCF